MKFNQGKHRRRHADVYCAAVAMTSKRRGFSAAEVYQFMRGYPPCDWEYAQVRASLYTLSTRKNTELRRRSTTFYLWTSMQ